MYMLGFHTLTGAGILWNGYILFVVYYQICWENNINKLSSDILLRTPDNERLMIRYSVNISYFIIGIKVNCLLCLHPIQITSKCLKVRLTGSYYTDVRDFKTPPSNF